MWARIYDRAFCRPHAACKPFPGHAIPAGTAKGNLCFRYRILGPALRHASADCPICSWAALVAGALPLILRRLGVDPAVVSAPLISTLVDGTGLLIYFEIARIVLKL